MLRQRRPVESYSDLVEFLQQLPARLLLRPPAASAELSPPLAVPAVHKTFLPFQGKNLLLWWEPSSQVGTDAATAAAAEQPHSTATT